MSQQTLRESASKMWTSWMGKPMSLALLASLVLAGPVMVWQLFVSRYSLVARIGFGLWSLFLYAIGLKYLPPWLLAVGTASIVVGGLVALGSLLWGSVLEVHASWRQEDARKAFELTLATQVLPSLEDDSFQRRELEFLTHRLESTLHEHRTSGASTSIGYRNWMSGRLQSRSQRDMDERLYPISKGLLFVTNQRIIFVGDKRSVTIDHNKVLSGRIDNGCLILSRENGKPIVVSTSCNPYELMLFHRLFRTYSIFTPNLAGVQLV